VPSRHGSNASPARTCERPSQARKPHGMRALSFIQRKHPPACPQPKINLKCPHGYPFQPRQSQPQQIRQFPRLPDEVLDLQSPSQRSRIPQQRPSIDFSPVTQTTALSNLSRPISRSPGSAKKKMSKIGASSQSKRKGAIGIAGSSCSLSSKPSTPLARRSISHLSRLSRSMSASTP